MNIDIDPRDFDRQPLDYVAENRRAREPDPFMPDRRRFDAWSALVSTAASLCAVALAGAIGAVAWAIWHYAYVAWGIGS